LLQQGDHFLALRDSAYERDHDLHVLQAHVFAHLAYRAALQFEARLERWRHVAAGPPEAEEEEGSLDIGLDLSEEEQAEELDLTDLGPGSEEEAGAGDDLDLRALALDLGGE
jgi:hypothetical protein